MTHPFMCPLHSSKSSFHLGLYQLTARQKWLFRYRFHVSHSVFSVNEMFFVFCVIAICRTGMIMAQSTQRIHSHGLGSHANVMKCLFWNWILDSLIVTRIVCDLIAFPLDILLVNFCLLSFSFKREKSFTVTSARLFDTCSMWVHFMLHRLKYSDQFFIDFVFRYAYSVPCAGCSSVTIYYSKNLIHSNISVNRNDIR